MSVYRLIRNCSIKLRSFKSDLAQEIPLRPLSHRLQCPCIFKVLADFVVQWYDNLVKVSNDRVA